MASVMLISLDYASDDVRRDTTADDADLERKIRAASSAVLNYANDLPVMLQDSSGAYLIDSNGIVADVPDDVQIATAMWVREFYEGTRGETIDPQYGYGYPSVAIAALLYPYRSPTAS